MKFPDYLQNIQILYHLVFKIESMLISVIFCVHCEKPSSFRFQNKLFSVGQFVAGIKRKTRPLNLAVPSSFTFAKGTQGFKDDPRENVYY